MVGAIAFCILFVILLGIAAFAVLGSLSAGADDSIDADVEVPNSGGGTVGSGGGTPVTLDHTVMTTESVTSPNTEYDTTPVETILPPPPATEAPPPKEPEPLRELVCTVGETAVISQMYPEDGLCDYIYYTSVVVLNRKLKALKIDMSWNVFKSQMKNRSKTGGGISFDYRYVTVAQLQQAKIVAELHNLVKLNIKHYGILNIIEEYYNILEKNLATIGGLITEMKKLQHWDSTRKTIVALGLFKYDQNIWEFYKNIFKRAVDDYEADTVIAISSVGALETEQDCYAVPTSVTTKHEVYPSLERHGELVKASFQYQKEGAVVGLSLEMGVLTYILRHESRTPKDIAYEPCWSAGPVSDASMVCPRDLALAEQLNSATLAGYVMGHNKVHVFFGDNVKTVAEKVEFIKGLGPRKQLSLLLFNVHLTDLPLRCFANLFDRVSKIKTLFKQY